MSRLLVGIVVAALSLTLFACGAQIHASSVSDANSQNKTDTATGYHYVADVSYMRNGMPTTGTLPISYASAAMTSHDVTELYKQWGCQQVEILSFKELSEPYFMTPEEDQLYSKWVQADGFLNAIRMTDKEHTRWLLAGSPENVWDYASLEQVYIAREKDANTPAIPLA